jgi:hypothetical protein
MGMIKVDGAGQVGTMGPPLQMLLPDARTQRRSSATGRKRKDRESDDEVSTLGRKKPRG